MFFWIPAVEAATDAELASLSAELAPFVRDEVGRTFLELPPVHLVGRKAAQERWRAAAQKHVMIFEHLGKAEAAEVVSWLPTPTFDRELAFYSSDDRTIYVVEEALARVSPPHQEAVLPCVVAHELVHALQDQGGDATLGAQDELQRFVIEGQATLWGQRACVAARGAEGAAIAEAELGLTGSLSSLSKLPTWGYGEARLWAMAVERDEGRKALWRRLAAPPADFAEVRRAIGPWDTGAWGPGGTVDTAVRAALATEGFGVTVPPDDPRWPAAFAQLPGPDGAGLPAEEIFAVEFGPASGPLGVLMIRGVTYVPSDMSRAKAACPHVGGHWNPRHRLCLRVEGEGMAVVRADSGGLTLLGLREPTLRPGVERVLLAALGAIPEKSYAEEVLQLAAHAPTALAVETSAPGWPWLARDAFTAEAEGDPDGCVRLAAAALPRSTSPNREPIEDQLLRCAWDARDAEATMLTLVSVAGVLTRGSVEQEAARMVHVGRAEWALRLLDAAPPPAKEDPDWNAYRVQTLLALGRLDDALTFARAHPAGHNCHADLAEALQRAGRRADSAEVRAMPDVEPDWGVP